MIIISDACLAFIRKYEALRLHAYFDSASVCTIGYGTIKYPPTYLGGRAVKIGDVIISEQAEEFLRYEVNMKARNIDALLRDDLTPNQFAALISFTYNLGEGALQSSTLRKKVNIDPNDLSIAGESMKWVNIHKDGKLVKLQGLVERRRAEIDIYFSK